MSDGQFCSEHTQNCVEIGVLEQRAADHSREIDTQNRTLTALSIKFDLMTESITGLRLTMAKYGTIIALGSAVLVTILNKIVTNFL